MRRERRRAVVLPGHHGSGEAWAASSPATATSAAERQQPSLPQAPRTARLIAPWRRCRARSRGPSSAARAMRRFVAGRNGSGEGCVLVAAVGEGRMQVQLAAPTPCSQQPRAAHLRAPWRRCHARYRDSDQLPPAAGRSLGLQPADAAETAVEAGFALRRAPHTQPPPPPHPDHLDSLS